MRAMCSANLTSPMILIHPGEFLDSLFRDFIVIACSGDANSERVHFEGERTSVPKVLQPDARRDEICRNYERGKHRNSEIRGLL